MPLTPEQLSARAAQLRDAAIALCQEHEAGGTCPCWRINLIAYLARSLGLCLADMDQVSAELLKYAARAAVQSLACKEHPKP